MRPTLQRGKSSCVVALLLACLPATAQASTDEQRLAAHLHTAESYFPAAANCTSRTVHLHADAVIDASSDGDASVEGLATPGGTPGYAGPCDVWLRSHLTAHNFYVDVFHELAHTTGWLDGPAMDRAVNHVLDVDRSRLRRRHQNRRARAGSIR